MDKVLDKQETHILAATIKLKLISFTKYMKFLTQKRTYIGLNMNNVKQITSTGDNYKVDLGDLRKEREQTKKNSKSSVLISSNYFKQYCCSAHIIKIFKVIK